MGFLQSGEKVEGLVSDVLPLSYTLCQALGLCSWHVRVPSPLYRHSVNMFDELTCSHDQFSEYKSLQRQKQIQLLH